MEIRELTTGGPVIGLLPEVGYEEGAIDLESGDVFVVFTDGVPEARVPRSTVRHLRAAIKNRELGRPGKGESLEHLAGLAAFVMMTDRAKGEAFMERIKKLIAARDAAPKES